MQLLLTVLILAGAVSRNSESQAPLPLGILKAYEDNPIYDQTNNATYEILPLTMELTSLPPPLPTRSQQTSASPSINSQSPKLMDHTNGCAEKSRLGGIQPIPVGGNDLQSQPSIQPPATPRYIEAPSY